MISFCTSYPHQVRERPNSLSIVRLRICSLAESGEMSAYFSQMIHWRVDGNRCNRADLTWFNYCLHIFVASISSMLMFHHHHQGGQGRYIYVITTMHHQPSWRGQWQPGESVARLALWQGRGFHRQLHRLVHEMELLGASAAGHPSTIKARDGERAKEGGVKLEEFGGHLGDDEIWRFPKMGVPLNHPF